MRWNVGSIPCCFAACFCSTSALQVSPPGSAPVTKQTFVHSDFTASIAEDRKALLQSRWRLVMAHNAKNTSSWTATLNHFSDKTHSERLSYLGYSRARATGVRTAYFMEVRSSSDSSSAVAEKVDHRDTLQSARNIHKQDRCGSCWAIASIGAIEMRLEHAVGNVTQLSWQQVLDCAPNPHQCGGQGGCTGATAEIAFGYVQQHGISSAQDYSKVRRQDCATDAPRVVEASSFVQLPVNRVQPILQALADGPLVVAVSADGWFEYGQGVFDGCPPDVVVNHAVLLVGYGLEDSSRKKYWVVRNSWGSEWGEEGFIRVLRHSYDGIHCGVDTEPQLGTGCADGPSQVTVCGMCGILSDASYPVGVRLASGVSQQQ